MRLDILKAMNSARSERRAGAVRRAFPTANSNSFGPKPSPPIRSPPNWRALCAWAKAPRSRIRARSISRPGAGAAAHPRWSHAHAQALARIAQIAGLDVTIIDPRTAFATPDRFPDAPIIAKWPDEALAKAPLDRFTAICLLTHNPKIDDPALTIALNADCFYIGALGSRKTHAKRIERMRAKGFDEATLQRIHAPIGLDIGAVSPAEIAVSIIGEIVASLRKKPLRAESAAA